MRKIGFVLSLLFCNLTFAADNIVDLSKAIIINTDQAYFLQRNGALFIDVRSKEKWDVGNIENSVNLDFLNDFSKLYQSKVPKDMPIVIYGEDASSLRSAYAVATATDWGFTQVYYYRDGYFRWIAHNLPSTLKMASHYHSLPVVQLSH